MFKFGLIDIIAVKNLSKNVAIFLKFCIFFLHNNRDTDSLCGYLCHIM